ncbi:protein toll-like isoform X2 [Mya arenaria]|uniref:protein toll-like isoform X2 n=1 Tax=Mya arenaria TaxID=6604 RepID=UPI0022E8518C|nr:protein toll-like isoform X2 [Mya arenaria]
MLAVFIQSLLLAHATVCLLACYNNSGYFEWHSGTRKPLCCPNECLGEERTDQCCSCTAEPCWEIRRNNENFSCPETLGQLDIEIVDVFGNAIIIRNPSASVTEVIYPGSLLTKIPENICDFADTLVKIDFSNNYIKNISMIKCLRKLDTIHLDNNLMRDVGNDTFSEMKNLRVLTLSNNNKLENIGPNVLDIGDQNICIVDFSQNDFLTFDVTNLFTPGPFCKINVSNGNIGDLTNELGYVLDTMNGPGDILAEQAGITHFFNFTALGIHFYELPKYFEGEIRIDASSFNCDCNIYPLVSTGVAYAKFWTNLNQSFSCNHPDWMKGKDMVTLLEENKYDELICELENCPSFCRCIDKPSENRVIVNCSDKGLTQFPDEMPFGYWNNKNIELLLARNVITEIPDTNYLWRLIKLDMSGNTIRKMNENALQNIHVDNMDQEGLIINGQMLDTLGKDFEEKDPHKIRFGDYPVRCDCQNLWVGDWIRINHPKLRALNRVQDVVSYEERNSTMLDRLKWKLGPPANQRERCNKADDDFDKPKEDFEKEYDLFDRKSVTSGDGKVDGYSKSVFERLYEPKPLLCNCKYRKCYLHSEALDSMNNGAH